MSESLPSPFTIFTPDLLQKIDKDFWNFNGTSFSYPQLSHRSVHYVNTNSKSQQFLRNYLNIPEDYQVLYLPTDCNYSSIPFNLAKLTNSQALYIVRDDQSDYAFKQAFKINPKTVRIQKEEGRSKISKDFDENTNFYTFYSLISAENGIKYEQLHPQPNQILVCNLNHCPHYLNVDISKHGILTFQTGRTIGLSGMSVVIVRKDLIGHHLPTCPDMMDYSKTLKAASVVNTPFTLVPLMIWKQLQHWMFLGLTPQKMKDELDSIKKQYTSALSQLTEVAKTNLEGIIKFKMPQTLQKETAEQYGTVHGHWLILTLQIANKGNSKAFVKTIF